MTLYEMRQNDNKKSIDNKKFQAKLSRRQGSIRRLFTGTWSCLQTTLPSRKSHCSYFGCNFKVYKAKIYVQHIWRERTRKDEKWCETLWRRNRMQTSATNMAWRETMRLKRRDFKRIYVLSRPFTSFYDIAHHSMLASSHCAFGTPFYEWTSLFHVLSRRFSSFHVICIWRKRTYNDENSYLGQNGLQNHLIFLDRHFTSFYVFLRLFSSLNLGFSSFYVFSRHWLRRFHHIFH